MQAGRLAGEDDVLSLKRQRRARSAIDLEGSLAVCRGVSSNLLKLPLAATLSGLPLVFSTACGGSPSTPADPVDLAPNVAVAPTSPDEGSVGAPVAPGAGVAVGAFKPAASTDLSALAASNNAFAVDLYKAVREGDGNLAMSPASISIALAMTYAGAGTETAAQMAKTMRFELPPDRLHAAFGTQLRDLAGDGSPRFYELVIANRLFGEKTVRFREPFLAITSDHYQAPLDPLDFKTAPDPSRTAINQWVATQTKDKIRDLLPEGSIAADTRLVLTNAIYFKGPWAVAFDKAATREETFKAPGGQAKVPMMRRTAQMTAAQVDGLKILELDYRGNDNSMLILLPDADDGLAALEQRLTKEALDGWIGALGNARVELSLPRFKIEPGKPVTLGKILSRMGMPLAFQPGRADFGHMAELEGEPPLSIDDVYHKAFVEVTEEGTEAAAATGVVMVTRSAPIPVKPLVFHADHPFLFVIRDKSTGALLFMGRVTNPRA